MATILLTNNWIPLLLPLVIIGTILVLPEYLYPFVQRQKLYRENKLVDKLTNAKENNAPKQAVDE
jgi:hypothetical protein